MQFLTGLLLVAATAQAHYTFPRLVVNGKAEEKDWLATRQTKNANSKQGIENPTAADIRCYQSSNAANIMDVPAGATINYVSTQQVNHPGPTQYYLAKVPAGQSAKTWDGSGAVWFKINTTMPSVDKNKQMTWPGQNEYKTPNATVPKATPDAKSTYPRTSLLEHRLTIIGEYLLRVEHIALHMASQANKAQFYLACTQVKITGGGNGTPGPLVSLPGAYKSTDPGILVNLGTIQNAPETYQPPGPAVWKG